jgi:hypothetical protein
MPTRPGPQLQRVPVAWRGPVAGASAAHRDCAGCHLLCTPPQHRRRPAGACAPGDAPQRCSAACAPSLLPAAHPAAAPRRPPQGQADEELWDHLIDWALAAPGTTAQLLDHIGGHINPLRVIERIQLGMEVGRRPGGAGALVAQAALCWLLCAVPCATPPSPPHTRTRTHAYHHVRSA